MAGPLRRHRPETVFENTFGAGVSTLLLFLDDGARTALQRESMRRWIASVVFQSDAASAPSLIGVNQRVMRTIE